MNIYHKSIAVSLIAIAWTNPASAQASADEQVEQDIVVTAQRRSESIQQVPISITAVSGEALQARNIVNAVDLSKEIPNIQIKSGFNASNPTIFMRGIGINDYSAASAGAIGVTLDDVFLNSTIGQLFQMYDLDRVEVLRGPQGTLIGRNTTGGAINFHTRRPGYELDPSFQITYGRFNELNAEGATSIPIVDGKAAARVSVAVRTRDGTRRNTFDGSRQNDVDSIAGRFQLLLEPSDNLEILAKFEAGSNRSTVFAAEGLGVIDPATGGFCSAQQILARDVCSNFLGYVESRDPYSGSHNVTYQPEDVDSYGGRLGITYDGSAVSLTSVSSWNLNKRNVRQDIDSSPFRVLEQPLQTDRAEQYSQEIRLASNGDGPFQWIFGGYYLRETLAGATGYEVFADANPTPGLPYLDLTGATTGGIPIFSVERDYQQRTTSYAAFTHLTYELSDKLKATLGGRYTWDRKSIVLASTFGAVDPVMRDGRLASPICCLVGDPASVDPLTGLPTQPIRDQIKFDRPMWRFALDYQLANRTLLYGSYSRGVRSGGFNAAAITDPLEFSRVRPEELDAFEVGFKSDLTSRFRLNGAVFYYYGDLQVFTLRSGVLIPIQILDIATVEGYGAELDATWRPIDGLRLGLSMGLFDGEYKQYPGTPSNIGNQLVQAPKVTLSGNARYDVNLSKDWTMALAGDFTYQSKVYFQPSNEETQSQAGYGLVNGRISFARKDSGIEASVWVKNLTNKTYLVDIFDTTAFGFYQANYSQPRTYGVSLSYRF